jgi:hypothetical protein
MLQDRCQRLDIATYTMVVVSSETPSNFHLTPLGVCSPTVTRGAKRGRATRAVSVKGAHLPQDVILMGVRWYVAYVRRENGMDKCGNTFGYTGIR